MPDGRGLRKTVGYLTTFLGSAVNLDRFAGLAEFMKQAGVDLFCFITRFLNDDNAFVRQSNVMIDFVQPGNFDGLVIGNIIKEDKTNEETERRLYARFQLPCVAIRENNAGISFIATDNRGGIMAVVDHLVESHGAKRIVYVRGPEKHPYAEVRYHAYMEALAKHGIRLDEGLVTFPASWWKSGFESILEDRGKIPGKDFDAVVCANDHLAIEVMSILGERGYKVPEHVRVTGFNNSPECRVSVPSLTSVELPFYQQGFAAGKLLLSALEKQANIKKGDSDEIVSMPPARLVRRESCGCIDRIFNELDIPEDVKKSPDVNNPLDTVENVFNEGARGLGIPETALFLLKENFSLFCEGRGLTDGIFPSLQQLMHQAVCDPDAVAVWRKWLVRLRSVVIPDVCERSIHIRLETLFQKLLLNLSRINERFGETASMHTENILSEVRVLGAAFISTYNIIEIMDELAKGCGRLGIGTCYISLYENPEAPLEKSRLIFGMRGGQRLSLDENGVVYPTPEIIPVASRPLSTSFSLVVSALYFKDRQIGFMCYQISNASDASVCEMIKEQLNNALQIALSIRDMERAQNELSEKAKELQRSNKELEQFASVASHDLREPMRKIIAMSDRVVQLRQTNHDADITDYLNRMNDAARRMQRLVDGLLEYSRVGRKALPFEEVSLSRVCCEVLEDLDMAVRKAGAVVAVGCLPVVEAEPLYMRQLFQNLIGNALKFRRHDNAPRLCITGEHQSGEAVLRFADNGIGIPKEYAERIFGIFERLHSQSEYEGSGIGLSICKKIVEHHGGRIRVESGNGEGTTFIVTLPIRQSQ